jgi:hypothetical protein
MKPKTFFSVCLLTAMVFSSGGVLASTDWDGSSGEAPESDPGETTLPATAGPVTQIFDPGDIPGVTSTVDFDDAVHHDCVNTRYLAQGVEFQRDDGHCVHAYDWAAIPRITSSPPMVMATTSGPGAPTFVPHINLLFDADTNAIGAWIGNDHQPDMVWTLEVFDAAEVPIGSVSIITNGNIHVDEYLGLVSTVPFRRARISQPNPSFSVVLDDLLFSATAGVPSMTGRYLVVCGVLLMAAISVVVWRRFAPSVQGLT